MRGRWLLRARRIVVYKMGEKGALTFAGGQRDPRPASTPTTALKPTGRGRRLHGRLPRRPCAQGLRVQDAVLRGSAAAAIVVARVGCAPAMPTTAELDAFLAAHPGPTIPEGEIPCTSPPYDNHNRAHRGRGPSAACRSTTSTSSS